MRIHSQIFLFFIFLIRFITDSAWAEKANGSSLYQLEVKILAKNFSEFAEIEVKMDPEVCGKKRRPPSVIVSPDSELQEAVAWVDGPQLLGWRASKADEKNFSAQLVQVNCEIKPNILIIPPGGVVRVLNKDPILHSLRAQGRRNYPSLRTHPPHLKSVFFKFEEPEIVPLYSDLHPWMKAIVVVAPHQSYALSNLKGLALIKNIPAGSYQLNLWHPILGTLRFPEEIKIPAQTKVEILWDASLIQTQQ